MIAAKLAETALIPLGLFLIVAPMHKHEPEGEVKDLFAYVCAWATLLTAGLLVGSIVSLIWGSP